jgi:hypothetical protein
MWKVRVLGGPSLSKGDSALVRGGFPATTAIMVIMRVLVEESLCQGSRGWRPILESFSVRCAWVSVVMSRRARS